MSLHIFLGAQLPTVREIAKTTYRIDGMARSSLGQPVPSARVTVTDEISATQAVVYSDPDLVNILSPVFADTKGYFYFYVPAGKYSLAFSGNDSFHAHEQIEIRDDVAQSGPLVRVDGVLIGRERIVNFIPGTNIQITGIHDPTNDEIEVAISGATGTGFGSPTAQIDIGDAQSDGVAGSSPRADHQHAFPAPTVTPTIGTAAALGTSARPVREDAVIAHPPGPGFLPNAHHNQVHALTGADHTGQDVALIPGTITDAQHGIRTQANAHGHGDLSGITPDQHHPRSHAILSASDHTGIQTKRVSQSVPAVTTVEVVVTWDVAFADANYTVMASLEGAVDLHHRNIVSRTATETRVRVENLSAGALTVVVHAVGIHD